MSTSVSSNPNVYRQPSTGKFERASFISRIQAVHLLPTFVLLAFVVPVLHRVHFPLSWDWAGLFQSFGKLALQSVSIAAVLYAIERPAEVLVRFRAQFGKDVRRSVLFAAFVAILVIAVGAQFAITALIDCVAIIEVVQQDRSRQRRLQDRARALLPATAYLFVGLVLAFTYTNAIVRVRFFGLYDTAFDRFDARFVGITVHALAHHVAGLVPPAFFRALNFIYYGMFVQIGAALIICGMSGGAKRSIQFVGTIAVAYYLALILFYLFPSQGPYYVCPQHFSRLPYDLASYRTQKNLLQNALYLWQQKPVRTVPMGFYIAFPCMHIAQPLIVLWFLRQWKRIVAVLVTYDLLLIAAIILLEWHYFADLLGGVAVAITAILLTARISQIRQT